MKMYEKLGMDTEAALKWVKECAIRYCRDCPAYETQELRDVCAPKYLLSDVHEPPKVPLVALIQTQEDLNKALKDLHRVCRKYRYCDECPYYRSSDYLVPFGRCFFCLPFRNDRRAEREG